MVVAKGYGLRGVALSRSFFLLVRGAAAVAACAGLLSGCVADTVGSLPTFGPKHLQPLSSQTIALIDQKGMDARSPILLRIFKEESELEIWKQNREGRYALLKTYPICRWSGELGPKIKEGDRQAPEGFYAITPELMNPRSSYYLAFNLGYPNEFDRAHGRTGAHLMVHGDCSSRGCYAMTDEQIMEIYALSRESFDGGQLAFQVQAFPFRMTAKNLARHRKNPNMAFWRMLKEGSDHFELTKQQPKVDVCEKRYVFNAHLLDPGQPFDATGKCPEYEIPEEVAVAARSKRETDDREAKVLAALLPAAPIVTGRDGGTNQAFAGGTTPSTVGVPASDDGRYVAVANRPAAAESAAAASEATASVPVPASRPASTASAYANGTVRASLGTTNGSSRGRTSASEPAVKPEPEEAAQPQERYSPPAALPGAAPIRSTGGFSYR
jgi:murein L,D-transpeptidase YafK